ncbi:MAG TPA: hypothetical protein PKW33_07190 [Anaerolineaceae bacterium]|nr:hypothetical protein [Anaerolineaceae bacterium]HPN51355.1 hypothetical protein [Anaerolineaceae bacterium]
MKNQIIRWGLKIWIGAAALATFIGGFFLIGLAQQPVKDTSPSTVQNAAPLPTLAPLPTQSSGRSFQRLPSNFNSSQPSTGPRLRTRGS